MTRLAAGRSNTATKTYAFPSAGIYYARACADQTSSTVLGTIVEANKENNCSAWAKIGLRIPDLVALAPTPDTADVGVPVVFSTVIKNIS